MYMYTVIYINSTTSGFDNAHLMEIAKNFIFFYIIWIYMFSLSTYAYIFLQSCQRKLFGRWIDFGNF